MCLSLVLELSLRFVSSFCELLLENQIEDHISRLSMMSDYTELRQLQKEQIKRGRETYTIDIIKELRARN